MVVSALLLWALAVASGVHHFACEYSGKVVGPGGVDAYSWWQDFGVKAAAILGPVSLSTAAMACAVHLTSIQSPLFAEHRWIRGISAVAWGDIGLFLFGVALVPAVASSMVQAFAFRKPASILLPIGSSALAVLVAWWVEDVSWPPDAVWAVLAVGAVMVLAYTFLVGCVWRNRQAAASRWRRFRRWSASIAAVLLLVALPLGKYVFVTFFASPSFFITKGMAVPCVPLFGDAGTSGGSRISGIAFDQAWRGWPRGFFYDVKSGRGIWVSRILASAPDRSGWSPSGKRCVIDRIRMLLCPLSPAASLSGIEDGGWADPKVFLDVSEPDTGLSIDLTGLCPDFYHSIFYSTGSTDSIIWVDDHTILLCDDSAVSFVNIETGELHRCVAGSDWQPSSDVRWTGQSAIAGVAFAEGQVPGGMIWLSYRWDKAKAEAWHVTDGPPGQSNVRGVSPDGRWAVMGGGNINGSGAWDDDVFLVSLVDGRPPILLRTVKPNMKLAFGRECWFVCFLPDNQHVVLSSQNDILIANIDDLSCRTINVIPEPDKRKARFSYLTSSPNKRFLFLVACPSVGWKSLWRGVLDLETGQRWTFPSQEVWDSGVEWVDDEMLVGAQVGTPWMIINRDGTGQRPLGQPDSGERVRNKEDRPARAGNRLPANATFAGGRSR